MADASSCAIESFRSCGSEKSLPEECNSGTGLQVPLEIGGPFPASEANGGPQSPGPERCSRFYDAFIMMTETAPHIVRETYIVAFWLRDRDNNVNKMHGRTSMVAIQTLHYDVM
jgi:hypothetical protein